MEVVTDLHLHSRYSRAVSSEMVVPQMIKWAKIKGINLLGTADFTHPLWLKELKTNLLEENGLLKLKGEDEIRFLLSSEISSIYSQGGKTRRIHNIILAPSFTTVEKINQELQKRGCNLHSDGRPIIGLSAKDLLDLVLNIDENCFLIPAHIWTPWFSLFGSKSGYECVEECFGDLSKHIQAIETGLSSDPLMNWSVDDLNSRGILSFSDAHSLQNIGREATIISVENLNYNEVKKALAGGSGVTSTIEFYPEEGMYHFSGHRKCSFSQSPEQTLKRGKICPVCGKSLTIGVLERVKELSNKEQISNIKYQTDRLGVRWICKGKRPPFVRLVPLREIIAESRGVGKASQGAEKVYLKLIESFNSELNILLRADIKEIADLAGEKIAEGLLKVREGNIFVKPGFDGEYGQVKIWG